MTVPELLYRGWFHRLSRVIIIQWQCWNPKWPAPCWVTTMLEWGVGGWGLSTGDNPKYRWPTVLKVELTNCTKYRWPTVLSRYDTFLSWPILPGLLCRQSSPVVEEVLINDHDYEMVKTDFHQPLLNKNPGSHGEKIQLLFPPMHYAAIPM